MGGRITAASTACAYGVFQDDDCEDLCGAFGEDSSTSSLRDVGKDAAMREEVEPSAYSSLRKFRRSRALWWEDPGPNKCDTCEGSGEQTCRFCGGTEFLSGIGGETDALFYEGVGKDCPVCDTGLEVCQKCAGTGWVFSWSPDKTSGSLHP
ncbi:hypothetical protein ACHAWF_010217 [Thalassiosira exigua]